MQQTTDPTAASERALGSAPPTPKTAETGGASTAHGPSSEELTENASPGGCLVRLTWLMFGHVALVTFAALILKNDPPLLSVMSVAYWGVVLVIVAARYLDIVHLDGTTADGDPATRRDLHRFSAVTVTVAAVLWAAVHVL